MPERTIYRVYKGRTRKLSYGEKYSVLDIAKAFDRSPTFVRKKLKGKDWFDDKDMEKRKNKPFVVRVIIKIHAPSSPIVGHHPYFF